MEICNKLGRATFWRYLTEVMSDQSGPIVWPVIESVRTYHDEKMSFSCQYNEAINYF